MTLSVLEGHSPIASLFQCVISYLWRDALSLCMSKAFVNFDGPNHNSGMTEATVVKFCTNVDHIKLVFWG